MQLEHRLALFAEQSMCSVLRKEECNLHRSFLL